MVKKFTKLVLLFVAIGTMVAYKLYTAQKCSNNHYYHYYKFLRRALKLICIPCTYQKYIYNTQEPPTPHLHKSVLDLQRDELSQLVKQIYGLIDSDNNRDETRRDTTVKVKEMNETTSKHSLFSSKIVKRLLELSTTYVNDILRAGTNEFLANSLVSMKKSLTLGSRNSFRFYRTEN